MTFAAHGEHFPHDTEAVARKVVALALWLNRSWRAAQSMNSGCALTSRLS